MISSYFVLVNNSRNLPISDIVNFALREFETFNEYSVDTWTYESTGFGIQLSLTSNVSKYELMPYVDNDSGCCIVANASIYYKNELANKLEIDYEELSSLSESKIIMMSYLKWGDDCIHHLIGDFSFAIWDARKNLLFCARDHFGCRPLFYTNQQDYFAVTTDPKSFKALPDFIYQLQDQAIIDAICSIIPSKDSTAFKDIFRLEPAHFLKFTSSNKIEIKPYWNLRVHKGYTKISEKQAIKGLKEYFVEAVKQRSIYYKNIGIELSGGLDSSGIAACLNNILKPDILVYALSHILPRDNNIIQIPNNDELVYSSKIVEISNKFKHVLISEKHVPGACSAMEEYLHTMQKPIVQIYAMMSELLYKKANELGVEVLFSGFGGDEGVTFHGVGSYRIRKIHKKFKQIIFNMPKRKHHYGIFFIKRLIIEYVKVLVRGFRTISRKDWRNSRYKVLALNNRLRLRAGFKKRYLKELSIPDDQDLHDRQHKRLMHPHISDRLENSYFNSKKYGIEYRYPFYDTKLLEFYFSLPGEYKYKNNLGRHLFRMAMEEIIPDEIRLRKDKTGATIPNVIYRIIKDENIFKEIIEEGRKKNRFHYVNYNRLLWMIEQFKSLTEEKKLQFGPRDFLSPMSVLILQKWQRERKVDFGIKC